MHRYCVYGIEIASDAPLALPEYQHADLGALECLSAPAAYFREATSDGRSASRSHGWYEQAFLEDGSTYVRWDSVGEFLVAPDGRRITSRRFTTSSPESFQVYMLGQAISFALVKQRLEPLHATAVVANGRAVAFLGSSAFGKSTLAACFLEAGCRLLTDDLLVLQQRADRIVAYPGPARIKLFPGMARRFLDVAEGPVRMNAGTEKLILPLDGRASFAAPAKIDAVYSLSAPSEAGRQASVSIETLSPRAGFLELLKGTFNRALTSPQRLERQFRAMVNLAERLPINKLVYPRSVERLRDVRAMVLSHLQP